MNSLHKDGLKKIYLLNSADYQFAEIDLRDNTLLLGESAVGKTTLMRAILFFYTMNHDASVLNINTESKKTFVQWYFKHLNSHIIYEYVKDGSTFLFIVSNSGKLHYTFVDISNTECDTKTLLLDETRPVTIEQLNENIETNRLPNYRTSSKEKYIQTFHRLHEKGKRIKHESKIDFSLFEDRVSRDEFAKTLSNIFATSKVSSDSIKKTVVSLIDDSDAGINLKEIQMALREYMDDRNQIRQLEEKIPYINELSVYIASYKKHKKIFKEQANQISVLKRQSSLQLIKIESHVNNFKEEIKKLENEYNPKIKKIEDDILERSKKNTIEASRIKDLKLKKEEYQRTNIDRLLNEYNNRISYENNFSKYDKRYKALTANAKEIEEKYKEVFQALKVNHDTDILVIKNEVLGQKKGIEERRVKASKEEFEKIKESTTLKKKAKQKLTNTLAIIKEAFNETKRLQAKSENFPYNGVNVKKYSSELEEYKDEIGKLESSIAKIDIEIKSVNVKIDKISNDLRIQKDKLRDKSKKKIDNLLEIMKNIEIKLDFDRANIYGYINKNSILNREKITRYIKDERLFSEKKFSVKKTSDNNSIFGLEIEFEAEAFEFNYEQASLLDELEAVKQKIKNSNESLRTELNSLEEKASKETSVLELQRTELKKEQSSKIGQLNITKSNKEISEGNLISAKEKAHEQKKEEENKLNSKYIEQEKNISELQSSIDTLSLEIDDVSMKIKKEIAVVVEQLDNEITIQERKEKNGIEKIEEEYEKDLKNSEDELKNALIQKGIDKELLQEVSAKRDEYEQKINAIKNSESIVVVYLKEYDNKIKEIPLREKNLEKEVKLLQKMEGQLETLLKELKEKSEIFSTKIDSHKCIQEDLNTFIKKYEVKIEKQSIENEIINVLSLSYKIEIEKLLEDKIFLDSAIEELLLGYSKLEGKRSKIITQTQRCTKGLDKFNIFKLDVIDDYMDASDDVTVYLPVAEGLIEYIDKDKINIVKDEASQKYKNHLNSIEKYLELFDNALMDITTITTQLRNRVKRAVESFNVLDSIVIKSINISDNLILKKLKSVTSFYSDNSEKFLGGLFPYEASGNAQNVLSEKIDELVKLLESSKEFLSLEEGFLLEFKVVENGNDLGWRQTLNDIGSNGTSTLVKTIINISILQMVNKNNQLLNHCILDEIGTISTDYFRELKEYVNNSGFLFVNGMPIEDDILISMYSTVYVGQKYKNYSRMLLASKRVI